MLRTLFIRGPVALLAASASLAALAQTTPHSTHGAAATSSAAGPAATVPAPLTFRSVFEGYQPFTDEKVGNWKQANDTVGEIGGWRAYAKEASQNAGQAQSPHQGHGQTPAQPQAGQPPARAANPHAGHGKQ